MLPFIRKCLLDDDYIGKLKIDIWLIFYLLSNTLNQIVSKDCVIKVYNFTKMAIDNNCMIIDSIIFFTRQFNLNLSESLSYSCTAGVIIIIHIFNIHYNKFRHSVSSHDTLKFVFPVRSFVNFESLHGFNIKNVYKFWNLIDENYWSNASELLG